MYLYHGDLYYVGQFSLNKHLANGHLELDPVPFITPLYLTLHKRKNLSKTDTKSQTQRCLPKREFTLVTMTSSMLHFIYV